MVTMTIFKKTETRWAFLPLFRRVCELELVCFMRIHANLCFLILLYEWFACERLNYLNRELWQDWKFGFLKRALQFGWNLQITILCRALGKNGRNSWFIYFGFQPNIVAKEVYL